MRQGNYKEDIKCDYKRFGNTGWCRGKKSGKLKVGKA
jgi:hypothetical protein